MAEEQKEILKNIGVLEIDYKNYYFDEHNNLYTPNEELKQTGKEVYIAYQESLNNTEKKPTETELLKQQLLETQAILAEMQYNNLLKENGGI